MYRSDCAKSFTLDRHSVRPSHAARFHIGTYGPTATPSRPDSFAGSEIRNPGKVGGHLQPVQRDPVHTRYTHTSAFQQNTLTRLCKRRLTVVTIDPQQPPHGGGVSMRFPPGIPHQQIGHPHRVLVARISTHHDRRFGPCANETCSRDSAWDWDRRICVSNLSALPVQYQGVTVVFDSPVTPRSKAAFDMEFLIYLASRNCSRKHLSVRKPQHFGAYVPIFLCVSPYLFLNLLAVEASNNLRHQKLRIGV